MKSSLESTLKKIDIKWKNNTLNNDAYLHQEQTFISLYNEFNAQQSIKPEKRLKQINALLKLLFSLPMDNEKLDAYQHILSKEAMDCLRKMPTAIASELSSVSEPIIHTDLIVLFYEGPIGRAYLETLNSLGIKPKKIIHLISNIHLQTQQPLPRWLPRPLRQAYGETLQTHLMHYWSKSISRSNPKLVSNIANSIEDALHLSCDIQKSARQLKKLSEYSNSIEKVFISSLSDPALDNTLKKESGLILFTGGGMMPASLLSTEQRRFLHIHPGFLPDIRGADGVLWSLLTRQKASATAFYMSPGIDQGDILLPCWLPEIRIDENILSLDPKTAYRALYAFIDPWVRSFVLRQLLIQSQGNLSAMDRIQQDITQGETFYFMHPELQKIALRFIVTVHTITR